MTCKIPNEMDNVRALTQMIRQVRLSRRPRNNPAAARTNINPQSGKSFGGTLNESIETKRE